MPNIFVGSSLTHIHIHVHTHTSLGEPLTVSTRARAFSRSLSLGRVHTFLKHALDILHIKVHGRISIR